MNRIPRPLLAHLTRGILALAAALTLTSVAQAAERDDRGSVRQERRDDDRGRSGRDRDEDRDRASEKEREKERGDDRDRAEVQVSLTAPAAGALFTAPATVTLTAAAQSSQKNHRISKVEFYQGTTLIGTVTAASYSATWSNAPAGRYRLTAKAYTDKAEKREDKDSKDKKDKDVAVSAPVDIVVNALPTVTLTSPSAGSVGIAPAGFTLTATASDIDGSIAKVEFFQNGSLVGTATNPPYSLAWSNVSPGNYSLTASATDNLGLQTTSTAITVAVIANSAPAISLTSPTQNQSFKAPATINLAANVSDPDNNLAKVEFFQNGNLIATLLTPPYTATWSNVGQGSYQTTAVATDAVGAQTTSAPTTITVTPAQASLYFIHPDHLGTPRLVTNEQNAIVWRHLPTSEPFGNTPPEEDPNATGQRFEIPLAFPGQYRDRESNLSYNFFRDYSSGEGRYRQSDPIGMAGGINPYGYVGGNPISRTDPTGKLFFIPAVIAAVLGGEGAASAMAAATVVAAAAGIWMANNLPPGYWPGDKGAKEWGRRDGCGAAEGKRRFHRGVKQGDNMSGAADNFGVNPETGDVVDPAGEIVGNLNDE